MLYQFCICKRTFKYSAQYRRISFAERFCGFQRLRRKSESNCLLPALLTPLFRHPCKLTDLFFRQLRTVLIRAHRSCFQCFKHMFLFFTQRPIQINIPANSHNTFSFPVNSIISYCLTNYNTFLNTICVTFHHIKYPAANAAGLRLPVNIKSNDLPCVIFLYKCAAVRGKRGCFFKICVYNNISFFVFIAFAGTG